LDAFLLTINKWLIIEEETIDLDRKRPTSEEGVDL
mgnify:CR=1